MENQFVVFKLNNESYGININLVKEIAPIQPIVLVPDAGDEVAGIINFRGQVIPVLDMKKLFHVAHREKDGQRLVIVHQEDKMVAMLVDQASETIRIDDDDIDLPNEMVIGLNSNIIHGISKKDDRLILLVDLKNIIHQVSTTPMEV